MTLINDLLGSMAVPVVIIASSGIVGTCFAVIFRMTPKTDHLIRIFYTTISAGGFAELISVLTGRIPTLPETLIVLGVGMLFMFDRRSGIKARPPRAQHYDERVVP